MRILSLIVLILVGAACSSPLQPTQEITTVHVTYRATIAANTTAIITATGLNAPVTITRSPVITFWEASADVEAVPAISVIPVGGCVFASMQIGERLLGNLDCPK